MPKEIKLNDTDTDACKECGGRTALVTGFFSYEPNSEPYNNGVEEVAKVTSGQCWVGAYKCDDCGTVQKLWTE